MYLNHQWNHSRTNKKLGPWAMPSREQHTNRLNAVIGMTSINGSLIQFMAPLYTPQE